MGASQSTGVSASRSFRELGEQVPEALQKLLASKQSLITVEHWQQEYDWTKKAGVSQFRLLPVLNVLRPCRACTRCRSSLRMHALVSVGQACRNTS
jgi:hypothetical protein